MRDDIKDLEVRKGFFVHSGDSIKKIDELCSEDKSLGPTHVEIGDKVMTIAQYIAQQKNK